VKNRWYLAANRDARVEWDFEDRLVKVTKADGTVVENTYDVDGVLVRTAVNGAGTDYLVDTSGGLSHVVAESDGSGTVTALYVRAGNMLLEEIRGGVAKMYEADGLGSTRSLLDTTGAQTDTWSYEAFGTTLSSTGTSANPYRFAGERLVNSVGMYQNRARWLDTRTGRFVSIDPMVDATGMPYLYGAASPASYVDPSGNEYTMTELMIGGACISAMATLAAQYARGQAMSVESGIEVAAAAAMGAYAAPYVIYSKMAAVLGIGVGVLTTATMGPIMADSRIPVDRRIAAAGVLFAGLYGMGAGMQALNQFKFNPSALQNFKPEEIIWTSWEEYPKVTIGGEEYAVIGSRLFTRHAVDRMQPSGYRSSAYQGNGGGSTGGYPQVQQAGGKPNEYDYGRSVPPKYIEDTIAASAGVKQPNGNIAHQAGSVTVILSPRGAVVTVMTE
jgi:RHS repeat-associated protein